MKIYTIEDLLKDHFRGRDVLPLMTMSAMAERWGKSRFDVANMKKRNKTFPAPLEGIVKGLSHKQQVFPFYEVVRFEQENYLKEVKASERTTGTKTTT